MKDELCEGKLLQVNSPEGPGSSVGEVRGTRGGLEARL